MNPQPIKETLVLVNRILAMEGVVGPFGHVSARAEDGRTFWVGDHRSPDAVTLERLESVSIEVTVEEARARHLYLEVFIHSAVYRLLPEVGAVVHTHSPYALALGTLPPRQEKVVPITNPGANLGNFIPVFSSVGLIDTPEKGFEVAQALQGQNGVLLRGHGTVVVGERLEQAALRAIYLESEARSQIWSRAAGDPIPYENRESDLFRHTRATKHAWDYYVEKLERL